MKPSLIACVVLAPSTLLAGPYDPPAGEYTSVESAIASSTPATLATNLRSALQSLTSAASNISYQAGRFRYDESDLDLDHPGNIILVYNGASVSGVWDSGSTFNREHTWPASHLANGSSGSVQYTDFHQLRPCNPSINSSRGNEPFGLGLSTLWDPGAGSFDDQDRGEMARAMFYAATRHNMQLIECTNQNQLANGQMGDRSTLLEWHFAHVADVREFYRNDYVDDAIQFNRNPYVDRNEYVWAIFGTGPNDSQITLDGQPASAGATALSIDLGDVIVGQDFATQSVGFTKTGTTPTTYRIDTTGDAVNEYTDVTVTPARSGGTFRGITTTDDWMSRCLAFPSGPSAHNESLGGVTLLKQDAPGARSGTITIDNTDLTSAGTGLANDDGDDVITLTGREVEHSNASFADDSDVDSELVDFGLIETGDATPMEVRITNLDAPSGFTAELRVTGVSGTGDTGAFDLGNIPTLMNLGAGNTSVNFVTVAETVPGDYMATYTIQVADNPIPGWTAGTALTLTVMATVEDTGVLCPADFNMSGAVDIVDFTQFATAFNTSVGDPDYDPQVDLNNTGSIDIVDFTLFSNEFGTTGCATN